jgi:hypothetical protein
MKIQELLLEAANLSASEIMNRPGRAEILISRIRNGQPFLTTTGKKVTLDKSEADRIAELIKTNQFVGSQKVIDDQGNTLSLSQLAKTTEFGGTRGSIEGGKEEGMSKDYNAGHLGELFAGLALSAKFFNQGEQISYEQVLQMLGFCSTELQYATSKTKTQTMVFELQRQIQYTNGKGKSDTLKFFARVPAGSAESFIRQYQAGVIASDLKSVLNSAIKYANESPSVQSSVERVMADPNKNIIQVVSDGTTAAASTKADLILTIDDKKVNLLSLKTYSSNTIGQISGHSYDQISRWFSSIFGIDISKYQSYFEPSLGKKQITENIAKVYDEVYPFIKKQIEEQTPNKEAEIVKRLSHALNVHARGASLENMEIIKLDDKIESGNYKILKISDDLVDAMTKLDLDVRMTGKGNSRTIQILVKPDERLPVSKKPNKLCQFRTQMMGDTLRNYVETGEMLTDLAELK